ncbi:hypothetical protein [Hymenobacter sp. GOD-10R]|uniref:hypothetical protein n=1 Tax=Hymenobacter sp. GOD-10R TaxID=3093922 RepID=UPI002D768126|nr:hypothetical protein [Hymenobacter sp. GOD-10R]WRQ27284.1 hypothetical protein SD425_19620 [Hymenobacter sp. GOD-10R]
MRFSFSVLLLGASLLMAGTAAAQAPKTTEPESKLGLLKSRVSYNLDAGMQFAGRYGTMSYISPTATYQVSNRFRIFAGTTLLRTQSYLRNSYASAADQPITPSFSVANNMLVQAGGTYLVNPRLALTGMAWKDLSNQPFAPRVNPYAGFGSMGSGVNIRADYQLTENISVSGGVRVSQGASPGYGYGGMYGSPMMPFGY